jgi:hypothetical protein
VVLEVLRDIYFVEKLHNGCDQKSRSFIKDTTIRGLNSCFDKITKSRGKDETKTTTRDDQRVKSALLSLKAFFFKFTGALVMYCRRSVDNLVKN